jgi:hypothetical protein
MPDTATVRERLGKLHPRADRIPEAALAHFALALPDDLDQVPYLDMTIEQAQPPLFPGASPAALSPSPMPAFSSRSPKKTRTTSRGSTCSPYAAG